MSTPDGRATSNRVHVGDRVVWTERNLNGDWHTWAAVVNQVKGDTALVTLDEFPWTGRDVPIDHLRHA